MKTTSTDHATVAVAELKARLSEYLRLVKGGAEVTVTERGKPIARLVQVAETTESANRMQDLIASGAARAPTKTLSPEFWKQPRPKDPDGRAVQAILDDREEGW